MISHSVIAKALMLVVKTVCCSQLSWARMQMAFENIDH